MKWLNYHHLYYFWTIATQGSIAQASKKLRLGQPTLSTQLKQLEDALGQQLFERRHKKLFLTEAGRIALEYANEIFKLGNEMVEALQDRLPASRLHVQVGALDSVPKSVVLELTRFAYKTASCTVSILEGKGDELLRELYSHRLDILISNYPPPVLEEGKLYAKSIARIPVVVCGTAKFRGLKKGFPRSLQGQPFVLSTRHSKLRHDLDHYFTTQEIQIDGLAETQDTSLQRLLALSGLGLIPINEVSARDLVREKRWVQLGRLPGVFEEIWLIAASRRIENPVAAKMMRSFHVG